MTEHCNSIEFKCKFYSLIFKIDIIKINSMATSSQMKNE